MLKPNHVGRAMTAVARLEEHLEADPQGAGPFLKAAEKDLHRCEAAARYDDWYAARIWANEAETCLAKYESMSRVPT